MVCIHRPLVHLGLVVVISMMMLPVMMVTLKALVSMVMPMNAVEHPNLLRREDSSEFDLHLGLSVHEFKLEAVQFFLLCRRVASSVAGSVKSFCASSF